MDDSLLVRRLELLRQLNPYLQRSSERQRSIHQRAVKRLALEQLHHQKGSPAVFFDGMHGANTRVVQRRSRPRFPQKTFERLRIAMLVFRQELQRHAPAELAILGLINHTHAAAAQLAKDSVMPDRLPVHREGQMVAADPPPVNWRAPKPLSLPGRGRYCRSFVRRNPG